MAQTLTIRIDGDVALEDSAEVFTRLSALLQALAVDVAPGVTIQWRSATWDAGSQQEAQP